MHQAKMTAFFDGVTCIALPVYNALGSETLDMYDLHPYRNRPPISNASNIDVLSKADKWMSVSPPSKELREKLSKRIVQDIQKSRRDNKEVDQ